MLPYIIELQTPTGPFQIPTYGTMMTFAFTLAFIHVHLRAKRIGVHPDRLIPIYLAAAAGGLLGSRLLYLIAVEGPLSLFDPSKVFAAGGFAFYGGFLGGAAGVFALARTLELNGWKLADLLAPALLLGMGIGRMGCFFAGCCHGAIAPHSLELQPLMTEGVLHGEIWLDSGFPFIITEFHDGVGRLQHQPLYPTQLWSITALLGLSGLLSWVWTRRLFDGQVTGMLLILEPISRIFIESFRADHRGYALTWPVSAEFADSFPLPGMTRAGTALNTAVIGLTTSQAIGLCMVALGTFLLATRWRLGVAPEVPIPEDD